MCARSKTMCYGGGVKIKTMFQNYFSVISNTKELACAIETASRKMAVARSMGSSGLLVNLKR